MYQSSLRAAARAAKHQGRTGRHPCLTLTGLRSAWDQQPTGVALSLSIELICDERVLHYQRCCSRAHENTLVCVRETVAMCILRAGEARSRVYPPN